MGGSAFHSLHSDAFPRIPPAVYQKLKSRLYPAIQKLYTLVTVPLEAPEKSDYGDLDFLVCSPKVELPHPETTTPSVNVPHESVKDAIGARHFIPVDGNRTSNFAVPISKGEWAELGLGCEEEEARNKVDDGEIYYQVDVHVCSDKKELDRIFFFNSYGDLGMIMGLVAANVGLQLGSKGLYYSDPPHARLCLTDDFDEIARFFGWSVKTRNAGFKTRREIFQWVATSHFFNSARFRSHGEGISKVKPQRSMYSDFVEWANKLRGSSASSTDGERKENIASARGKALEYFSKKDEVESRWREYEARKRMKATFNGNKVKSWTLSDNWKDVKSVMDKVRERYGGDEGVSKLLEEEGEDILKERVLEAFEKMKI
ncbi:hypothetical protein VKT23_003701 [Stygiomarasmius scandens]|uniref:Nucleotidyltransferase n=1 Tax=Marasmiellus scandens TaxID=2682957 RepID=A0ABR1JY13_9AGAR